MLPIGLREGLLQLVVDVRGRREGPGLGLLPRENLFNGPGKVPHRTAVGLQCTSEEEDCIRLGAPPIPEEEAAE
jgi:hypothetical protein